MLAPMRRRLLCSAVSSAGRRLPQWGSFGKSQPAIESLISEVKEVNEHQVAITRELSRISARLSAILTNPRLWFDPEAREQFREGIEVHLDRYARINNRLLLGCEYAYEQVAEEWARLEPDFDGFVRSGAMDAKIARVLREGAAKCGRARYYIPGVQLAHIAHRRYRSAGLLPTLCTSRVSAEVLYVSTLTTAASPYAGSSHTTPVGSDGDGSNGDGEGVSDVWLAHVCFRTREARSVTPRDTVSGANGASVTAPSAPVEGSDCASGTSSKMQGSTDAPSGSTLDPNAPGKGHSFESPEVVRPQPFGEPASALDGRASENVGGSAHAEATSDSNGPVDFDARDKEAAESFNSASDIASESQSSYGAAGNGSTATSGSDSESDAFKETVQIWTFAAELPYVFPNVQYLQWLRASMAAEVGADAAAAAEAEASPPLTWKLVDINYTVAPYQPPELPETGEEFWREYWTTAASFSLMVVVGSIIFFSLWRGSSSNRPPPVDPPFPPAGTVRRPPALHHSQPSSPSGNPIGTGWSDHGDKEGRRTTRWGDDAMVAGEGS